MDGRNILKVLICVLALSCVIVAGCVFSARSRILYLPDKAAEDLIALLEESGIHIDGDLVSTKKQTGNVYVCASADYNSTVAALLDGHDVDCSFVTPEGEIILMEGGGRVEFGDGFYFRYYRDGAEAGGDLPAPEDVTKINNHLSEEAEAEIRETAVRFLERGSENFTQAESMSVVTSVEQIWENGGRIYALCKRAIDGVEINDNIAICVIDGGEVSVAYGSWCFLTLADSYSAQLHDMINILFNVKKELAAYALRDGGVRIEAVERCYSLYVLGEDGDFCLIPCWKVVTDSAGEYIYNALDSTLYTKNK